MIVSEIKIENFRCYDFAEIPIKSLITLVWHFLQQPKERILVQSKRSKEQIKDLKTKIINNIDKIINKIENKDPFETKKTMLCNWCYYYVYEYP